MAFLTSQFLIVISWAPISTFTTVMAAVWLPPSTTKPSKTISCTDTKSTIATVLPKSEGCSTAPYWTSDLTVTGFPGLPEGKLFTISSYTPDFTTNVSPALRHPTPALMVSFGFDCDCALEHELLSLPALAT